MKNKINLGLLVLRLGVGSLMLLHGIAKLQHGVSPIIGMLEAKSLPAFLAYGVFLGEILAPLAIIIGFRTKLASIVFLINVIVAVVLAHPSDVFALNQFGGWAIELLGLYGFAALALIFTGGGKYSLSSSCKWD